MSNYKNLQEAFISLSKILNTSPEVHSRGSSQKEVICASFKIEDPSDVDINVEERKFSSDYAVAEWLWYMSRESGVKNIGKLAKIWLNISDENGRVESNYGTYLMPQWEWTKQELLNDRDTRRATIVINQPYHKIKNKKDYPCTQYIQFFIRDNKLSMSVNMRSNDLVFGLCNDVFTFCLFQQLMLNDLNHSGLNLELGEYYHHAGSLHVYERHYEMVEKISKNNYSLNLENRFVLSSGITSDGCPTMPAVDMPKEEILKYVKSSKEKLFREYT